MPEVVGAFLSTELWQERANRSVETLNSARCDLAQQRLEFAVRHLDGIKVRRVLRQVAQCRPCFLDRLLNAGNLVSSEVIHHDDVVTFECWNQALLDISQKHLSRHWPVDHHRRGHFVVTQRGYEGDRRPFPKWNLADHPDSARSPPPQAHPVGTDGGFVDKTPP